MKDPMRAQGYSKLTGNNFSALISTPPSHIARVVVSGSGTLGQVSKDLWAVTVNTPGQCFDGSRYVVWICHFLKYTLPYTKTFEYLKSVGDDKFVRKMKRFEWIKLYLRWNLNSYGSLYFTHLLGINLRSTDTAKMDCRKVACEES